MTNSPNRTEPNLREVMAEMTNEGIGHDPFLDAGRAADALGITPEALSRLRRRGTVRAVRSGWGRWLYRASDLRAYERAKPDAPIPNEQAPIVRFANAILVQAIDSGASDIHIRCDAEGSVVEYRIWGVLKEAFTMPQYIHGPAVTRFKMMAEISPAGGYPKASIFLVKHGGRNYTLRVSCFPTSRGEALTMRILAEEITHWDWNTLGLGDVDRTRLEAAVSAPGGLVLLAGPIGAGVTTTAFRLLAEIDASRKNVVAMSALREYALPRVTQMLTGVGANAVPAAGLLESLRYQDVEVLLVDGLLDATTAPALVETALDAGTTVIATVNAVDAAAAVQRLREYGVSDSRLERALRCVAAQRLLRRTCSECAGRGCPACGDTGFKGRFAVFEVMDGPAAAPGDFVPLRQAAEAAARRGETSPDEVTRVFG